LFICFACSRGNFGHLQICLQKNLISLYSRTEEIGCYTIVEKLVSFFDFRRNSYKLMKMSVKASIVWANVCFENPRVFPVLTPRFVIGNFPGKQVPVDNEISSSSEK